MELTVIEKALLAKARFQVGGKNVGIEDLAVSRNSDTLKALADDLDAEYDRKKGRRWSASVVSKDVENLKMRLDAVVRLIEIKTAEAQARLIAQSANDELQDLLEIKREMETAQMKNQSMESINAKINALSAKIAANS